MGTPARRYSWPAFETGNTMALRHGARSARKVDPLTEELAAGLLADRPDLERYPETVMAWARAEARCLLIAEWQAEVGLIDRETGDVRGGQRVAQFERLAADLRGRLGLDPSSEADLQRARSEATRSFADLEGIMASGRAAIAARSVGAGRPDIAVGDEDSGEPGAGAQRATDGRRKPTGG